MTQEKLERINALARAQKERELTPAERAEQAQLRQAYLAEWRAGARDLLENTYVVDKNGVKHKLKSYNEHHKKK
jgi:uncharacterized protein YnzC (UPF0291/DUF896 family)